MKVQRAVAHHWLRARAKWEPRSSPPGYCTICILVSLVSLFSSAKGNNLQHH